MNLFFGLTKFLLFCLTSQESRKTNWLSSNVYLYHHISFIHFFFFISTYSLKDLDPDKYSSSQTLVPSYLFELHELGDVSFFIHKTSGIILSLWCCLRIKWANIHRAWSIAPLVTLDHSCQHASPSSPKHQSSYLSIFSLQKTDTERHYAANLQIQVTLYISSPTSWKKNAQTS